MTNLAPLQELPKGGNDLGGTHRPTGGSEWGGFSFFIGREAGGKRIKAFITATAGMGEPASQSAGGRTPEADIPKGRASAIDSSGGASRSPGFSRTSRAT